MKAIDLVRGALEMTHRGTLAMVADMADAAMTRPTSAGGNHPLWVMGHLAFIEGAVPQVLLGEDHPVGHWAPLFAPGTEPMSDASAYPPFAEVVATYTRLRERNLRLLNELGDGAMDRVPPNPPPGMEDVMRTFGQTFQLIALHQMVHYGQIADARRVAGRKPLM